LRALIYLCLMGKEGFRDVAVQCHSKAEYLKARLRKGPDAIGQQDRINNPAYNLEVAAEPTFNEFVVRLPRPASQVVERMLPKGFLAGLPVCALESVRGEAYTRSHPNDLLIAVTEKHTRPDLDAFAALLEELSWS
jgi:glycine dehydrogenase subunit 1